MNLSEWSGAWLEILVLALDKFYLRTPAGCGSTRPLLAPDTKLSPSWVIFGMAALRWAVLGRGGEASGATGALTQAGVTLLVAHWLRCRSSISLL